MVVEKGLFEDHEIVWGDPSKIKSYDAESD